MEVLPPHLKQLDERLTALPDSCEPVLLSELDGYLAGILVCPVLITPSEWFPAIWGGDDEDSAPVFDNAEEVEVLLGLIMRHYNAINRDLQRGQGRYGPIYDVDPRTDEVLWEFWIAGFERAMARRPESWASLLGSDDEDVIAALTVLVELISLSHGDTELPDETEPGADQLVQEAPDLIPHCIETLYRWRLEQTGGELPSGTKAPPKVGRNDQCPCGSGKKYKKCCGLN